MVEVVPLAYVVDTELVQTARRLVERIESGEVRALAYVAVGKDGSVSTAHQQALDQSGGYRHYLTSGCATLMVRIAMI